MLYGLNRVSVSSKKLMSLPLAPRLLFPKSSHTRCYPFPEHTVHPHASKLLIMVFPLLGSLVLFSSSLISSEHLLVKAQLKHYLLCKAILDLLHGRGTLLWFPRACSFLATLLALIMVY